MEEKELFWKEFLSYIEKQPELDYESLRIWIDPVIPLQMYNRTLTIEVPNELSKHYWENRLIHYMNEFSNEFFGFEYQINMVVHNKAHYNPSPRSHELPQNMILEIDPVEPARLSDAQLNPNYTFENFVIGEDNKMAHGGALAVCDRPGKFYNPFLIYGGVGLGKTHLMQAIGHEILRKNPTAKVKYATIESFMNDFITSIQNGSQNEFREMYREVDVLLIDDIQFLSAKDKTKEEFFHTFNELYQHDKQIVLTCDRLPSSIEGLEERLVSRFKWGLSADITPPDFETRIAILRKKASSEFDAETLTYIANHINTNIRELEGALLRITAYAATIGKDITVSLAAEALSSMIKENSTQIITIETITAKVAKYYDISITDIKGKKRNKEIVYPRQIAMYLARELTDASFPKIGEYFGNRNHTTVIHAYEKVIDNLKIDFHLENEIKEIKLLLKN